jgi:hypothetical protein
MTKQTNYHISIWPAPDLTGDHRGERSRTSERKRLGVDSIGSSPKVRFAPDSLLEEARFEPSVPRSRESQIFRRRPALQDKSGSIKLPIAWGSTRRIDHLGSFLLRHTRLENIGLAVRGNLRAVATYLDTSIDADGRDPSPGFLLPIGIFMG